MQGLVNHHPPPAAPPLMHNNHLLQQQQSSQNIVQYNQIPYQGEFGGNVNPNPNANAPGEQCCQGCLNLIHDRYYLLVMDKAWHLQCLRCVDCKLSLDSQQSCFAKDGLIYCKDDYFK